MEHLKIFGYCIKLTEIFIQSIRENGILSSKVKGHWTIKKHIIHEVVIIEHFNYACNTNLNENVFDRRGIFLKNLLAKEKEKEKEPESKEKEIEEEFDFNSEIEMYPKKSEQEEEEEE